MLTPFLVPETISGLQCDFISSQSLTSRVLAILGLHLSTCILHLCHLVQLLAIAVCY